jgi:ferrous iron transport protein B
MATRTIDSAKERLTTIFVVPWMSCSARLPVYFLIVPLLLHENEGSWKQALVLFVIYTLGTLSAFVVARVLRGRLGPDAGANHFLLELPPYRAPQWSYIFRHVLERGWSFVAKAGTIILGL